VRKLTGQAFNAASQEVNVSGLKYKIGQLMDYLGRASGVYQITQLMAPEGEFQYCMKDFSGPHERVAKGSELRSAA
jgi:hypothetical protein